MSKKIISASLALAMAFGGTAFAQQDSSPVCNHTKAVTATHSSMGMSPTNTMAGTSSDAGNTATGASSASMGTGNTDKVGVNSPCVPSESPSGSTGALPNTP